MWEKNSTQRLLIIGGVILAALFVLLRYDKDGVHLNLRPGTDIAGGVTMIFEIQEEPGDRGQRIAEQMVTLLKKRVDPRGIYDLTWRVLGSNRIQVQMPLPPAENQQLKADYIAAEDALFQANTSSGRLEKMFRLPPEQRLARIAEFSQGDPTRAEMLTTAAAKYDVYQPLRDAQPAEDADPREHAIALRKAREELEDAKDAILATNLRSTTFQATRDAEPGSATRKAGVAKLKENHPALADEIDAAIAAHDAWRGKWAGLESPADLQRLLRGAGVLEYRILSKPSADNVTKYDSFRKTLEEKGPHPEGAVTEQWFRIDNPMAFFAAKTPAALAALTPADVERNGIVAGKRGDDWYALASVRPEDGMLVERGPDALKWKLKSAAPSRDDQGRQCVAFTFDAVGGSKFAKLTGAHINDELCLLIDDVAYSHANILSKISTRGQITGDFSREKINYLVQTMNAGVLPARLKDTPLSENTIGSSLGASNLRHALTAGIAGIIAVGIVMMLYYFVSGAIANVALVLNIMLVLAAMAMLGARFTLAGIAGVILTIGMTVDANVLIFDRMREEKQRGSSLRMIIKNGYEKAFSTIIDANITTLLICVIIYKVGSEEIKGFGLTPGWGIVPSLLTSLFVTRTLFTVLVKNKLIKDIGMLQLIGVPNIDWYAKRRLFGALSIMLISAGLFARMLTAAGAHRVLTVEIHNDAISGMFDASQTTLETVYLTKHMVAWMKERGMTPQVVVSPDVGGMERARRYAERMSADLAALSKERDYSRPNKVVRSTLIGDVDGRNILLVDDIIDTAGSVCAAIDELKKRGAADIAVACAHPVLSDPAWERLRQVAQRAGDEGWRFELIGTTTVVHNDTPGWYSTYPIEVLLAQVITKINSRGSVTGL